MAIRKCALSNPAFARLYSVYSNRDEEAKKWRAAGGKVVGQLGCDVPDELIIAAGMLPVRIYADMDRPLKEADKYLEFSFEPKSRAHFEKIIDGTYSKLIDALAISNSTDVLLKQFQYLRELKRIEPEMPIPETDFIDWQFTRNRQYQVRNETMIKWFIDTLEKWSGRHISDEDIKNAGRICNENRRALREMSQLRCGGEMRINGSEALVIIGSAMFMDRAEHTRLVKEVVESAKDWPVLEGQKVFFTGSTQENTEVYDVIESCGAVIIAEDHDWGDRFYERDFNPEYSTVRAIVDRYMLREFSSKKSLVSQRVAALDREVNASGANGVIFYMNAYEEAASWDYPSQKKSLEERGIHAAYFVKMPWPLDDNTQQLASGTEALVDRMKGDV